MIGTKGLFSIAVAGIVGGFIVYNYLPRGEHVLDKQTLIKVLSEIQGKFSEEFLSDCKINCKKRRVCQRGQHDYVYFAHDLKTQASNVFQRVIDSVFSQYKLDQEILTRSIEKYASDPDVKATMARMNNTCPPTLSYKEEIENTLNLYISKVENIDDDNLENLNAKMKMLEEETLKELEFEHRDIHAGIIKYSHEISAKQLHDLLRESNTLF